MSTSKLNFQIEIKLNKLLIIINSSLNIFLNPLDLLIIVKRINYVFFFMKYTRKRMSKIRVVCSISGLESKFK